MFEPQFRSRRAFTLVEALCVFCIIAILVGLLSGATAKARKNALNTHEISHLHQLGLAAALYYDETGHHPLSIDQLYRAGLVHADICKSPLDPYPDGMANEYCKALSKSQPRFKSFITDYPRTYLGLGDFGHPESSFLTAVLPHPGAGWLVSLTESTPRPPNKSIFDAGPTGRYTRLLMDGSVASRTHRTTLNAYKEVRWSVTSMYMDEP